LILALEDLHWSDPSTLDVIAPGAAPRAGAPAGGGDVPAGRRHLPTIR
jgi:hypothetical protein